MKKLLLFFFSTVILLASNNNENNLKQTNITKNGITFSINNSVVLDSDTKSYFVVYQRMKKSRYSYEDKILDTKISYSYGIPSSFKFRKFEQLDKNFVAVQEWTGGGSCCVYIHIYATKPEFKKIFTYDGDILKFVGKNTIKSFEDRDDVDLSKYPNCCRPQKVKEIQLTPNGTKVLKEYNLEN